MACHTDEDDYGNVVQWWDEAVTRYIYGANSPVSSEDPTRGTSFLIVTRVLLLPKTFALSPFDKITLPDEPGYEYSVEGVQSEGTRNPFGWNPGGTVTVRRVDA
ncbi:hypothetical protein [Gordonia sp. MMO-8]|uniref:hypothetical protein n=1 Tax=Gordonia sp. MMO-8 TaxID=3127886 RepID=UPI0030172D76